MRLPGWHVEKNSGGVGQKAEWRMSMIKNTLYMDTCRNCQRIQIILNVYFPAIKSYTHNWKAKWHIVKIFVLYNNGVPIYILNNFSKFIYFYHYCILQSDNFNLHFCLRDCFHTLGVHFNVFHFMLADGSPPLMCLSSASSC